MPADPLHLAIPDGLDLTGALCRTTSLGERVRVAYRTPKGGWVCVYVDGGGRAVITLPARCLRLDLWDDVSRLRVLQWLVDRDGFRRERGVRFRLWRGSRGTVLKIESDDCASLFTNWPDAMSWLVVGLGEIDPNDNTRLPDGSRRADAMALAAVVRQYAELAGEAPC